MDKILINKRFARLLCGQSISALGDNVSFIALPMLVLKLTSSPLKTGLAFSIQFLPYVLFSLFAGVIVDKIDKRKVMYIADFGRALAMVTLPLASLLGITSLFLIYSVIFIVSSLSVFFNISYQSIIPELVNRQDLAIANSRLQSAHAMGSLVGPALGGLLVVSLGPANALGVDALTFALSGCFMLSIRSMLRVDFPPIIKHGTLASVREGIAYLWGHPVIRSSALLLLGFNLFMAPYSILIIMYGEHTLNLSGSTIGLIITCGGVGALGASLFADRLGKFLGMGPVTIIGVLSAGLLSLILALAQNAFHTAIIWGLLSAVPVILNVNLLTLRQSIIPAELLGRVNSVYRLIAWCSIPLAGGLAGVLAQLLGIRFTIAFVGFGLIALAGVALISPLRVREHVTVTAGEHVLQ